MTLGSVIDFTMGGYRIKTQSDGEVKTKLDGVVATANTTGSGKTIYSGEVRGGTVTIPCFIYPDEAILIKQKIRDTPDEGWPCTFTLMNGTVFGFNGTIVDEFENSIKDGKCDLTLSAENLRKL